MKAILYIGAILMVGASIYGFIDYNKSSHDKNFKKLYDNKERAVMPRDEKSSTTSSVPDVKMKEENKALETSAKTPLIVKKKRKIRSEEFSRAALDEKYLKEEIKPALKKESEKTETKKQ